MDSSISSSPPPPKKLKMSTTTSDEENPNPSTSETKKQRFKRRKIAIFLAYCGVGYQGMQKNPGAKTIESDLEEALFLAGAVPEPDRGNPKRFDWARSARTDKGVSAVGQVVSGRFYIDPPGLVDRLNSHLSSQIRIFGYKRVTGSFSAKKFCDRRRYVYLIPVFALDPNSHPNRESVLASIGSGNVLLKCSECSDRGRKVVGVMGRRGVGYVESNGSPALDSTFSSGTEKTENNAENGNGSVLESRVLSDVDTVMEIDGTTENNGGPAQDSRVCSEEGKNEATIETIESNARSAEESRNSTQEVKIEETEKNVESTVFSCVDTITETEGTTENNGGPAQDTRVCSEEGKTEVTVGAIESNDRSAEESRNSSQEEKIEETEKTGERNGGAAIGCRFSSEEGEMEENEETAEMVVGGIGLDSRVVSEEEKVGKTGSFCSNGEQTAAAEGREFRYGEKERERFNGILKHYLGTHNFHNFTTRIKAEDPSARRYIVSFNADDVVSVDGMEFVRCEVVGQSFMLHQIRKMIGLAVAVMRNCAPESLLETALKKDINVNVPTAPEVGLYLDECMFTSYNQKWKESHEELSMEAYMEQAEYFKMKHIYSHIASMEQKEGVVALWLHSLNHRNYPDFHFVEASKTCTDMECTQEAKMEE